MSMQRVRYPILDDIRGITLISMILFHAMWDVVYIYDVKVSWYHGKGAYVWQQSICWTFIFLSGFCWLLGHQKWKRSMFTFGAGMLVSLVTCIFMPDARVIFGVLTLLGTCMFLMIPLERVLRLCPAKIGVILSLLLFVLCRNINEGYLGFEDWNLIPLPKGLYANLFMTFLGFTERSFYSADYFSLFPWFFLYVAGYFFNRCCVEEWGMKIISHKGIGALEAIGRNSMSIYLLHQPLLYGILYVVME